MANLTLNELKVYPDGTEAGKKQFNEFINALGDDKLFSFQKLIPRPKIFDDLNSKPKVLPDDEYEQFKLSKEYKNRSDNLLEISVISKSMSDELLEKYQSNNWLDWSYANWGCKWDVSDCKIYKEDKNFIYFTFLTPLCSPNEGYRVLNKMFPNLYFKSDFEEVE
jgi:hypothetical protein